MADLIPVRSIDDDAILTDNDSHVVPSPDGTHLFFVTRHGNLKEDCVAYDLRVFAINDLRAFSANKRRGGLNYPVPQQMISLCSASSDYYRGRGIMEARWLDDSNILFKGVQGQSQVGFYRVNISSGLLERLTDPDHAAASIVLSGESFMYMSTDFDSADRNNRLMGDPIDVYPAVAITGDELRATLTGFFGGLTVTHFASYQGGEPHAIVSYKDYSGEFFGPSISPDGEWGVMVYSPGKLPDVTLPLWEEYREGGSEVVKPERFLPLQRFMLVNLKAGSPQPMLDTPTGRATAQGRFTAPRVLWMPDSRHALLVNTTPPVADASKKFENEPYVLDYEFASGRWSIVGRMQPPDPIPLDAAGWKATADWLEAGKKFLVKYSVHDGDTPVVGRAPAMSLGGTIYERQNGNWVARTVPQSAESPRAQKAQLPGDFSVKLHQSANEAPTLVAFDGKRQIPLLEPDPALARLRLAPMREVKWTDPDGKIEAGGLIVPRKQAASLSPPLVIQAYHYQPHQFTPDGPYTTAYAAQALVARGMAVLFMEIPSQDRRDSLLGTPKEPAYFVARVDAAVESLARQRLIDPKRVGLVGFSRGGFMTYYAVTHPGRTQLGAAIDADGWTASYGEYVSYAASGDISGHTEFESVNGGRAGSFWKNREAWLENAPGFNVHRVKTPTLFTSSNLPQNNVAVLETLGAFRLTERPYEFLLIPKGSHELHRPRERLASMTATVDWMSFWLMGYEDPDVAKIDKYARWRKTRARWETVKRNEAAAREIEMGH